MSINDKDMQSFIMQWENMRRGDIDRFTMDDIRKLTPKDLNPSFGTVSNTTSTIGVDKPSAEVEELRRKLRALRTDLVNAHDNVDALERERNTLRDENAALQQRIRELELQVAA